MCVLLVTPHLALGVGSHTHTHTFGRKGAGGGEEEETLESHFFGRQLITSRQEKNRIFQSTSEVCE